MFYLVNHAGASRATVITYINPMVATLLGVFIIPVLYVVIERLAERRTKPQTAIVPAAVRASAARGTTRTDPSAKAPRAARMRKLLNMYPLVGSK